MSLELARKIADAVLYEGYVLYPYRASAAKNRYRWQFGVVAPRRWSESGGGDPWEMQTECLIEPRGSTIVDIVIRFLQAQSRIKDGAVPWEEGVERAIEFRSLPLDSLVSSGRETLFEAPPIAGVVRIAAESLGPFIKLRVRIENLTDFAGSNRSEAMRHSLNGAHTLLSITGGAFVSLTDPPSAVASAAAACKNLHTWPVLVGPDGACDVMLSSPIILPDYPAIAPESQGDFCDATEIDELLTLRVMTLTDDEKREARATDERAGAVIDRCDTIPPEIFERLHGAIRYLRVGVEHARPFGTESFFNPAGEDPDKNTVEIGGRSVSKGERVRMRPRRRSDSMDIFLAGRAAIVQAVHHDVDNRVYVAVTVQDDPAAEMHGSYQRFFYFGPEELELIERKET